MVYYIGSICSIIAYLIIFSTSQFDLIIGIITIIATSLWITLRITYFKEINDSLTLLLLVAAINILRIFTIPEDEPTQLLIEILLHMLSIQNNQHKWKMIAALCYCVTFPINNYEIAKVFSTPIMLCLMIQTNTTKIEIKQQESQTPMRRSPAKHSFTWNHEQEINKMHSLRQEAYSYSEFNNKEQDYKSDFIKLYENSSSPAVMIDISGKPLYYNSAFENVVGAQEKSELQYALISMKINKLDKQASQMMSKRNAENSKSFNFGRQQSMVQQQSFMLQSIASQKKEIQMHDLLEAIQREDIRECRILWFSSDVFNSTYQINISYNADRFLLMFINVLEREDYTMKEQTKQLMNQLFRSFSHEFSTSLNCIRMLAENAQEELSIQIVTKYINPMLNSCYILNSIVQDIRDFSMILSKNYVMNVMSTNLSTMIQETLLLFTPQIENKGLQLIVEIVDEAIIYTDGQRVRQCLINLLSNAQKFTEKGKIKVSIQQRLQSSLNSDQKYYEISVEDTGVGMDEAASISLNQFLLSNYKNKLNAVGSYGIGLLISNKIASGLCKGISGGIKFVSELGNGSKFWFLVQELSQEIASEVQSRHTIIYKKHSRSYTRPIEGAYLLSPQVSPHNLQMFNFPPAPQMKNVFLSIIKSEHSENASQLEELSEKMEPYVQQAFRNPNEVVQCRRNFREECPKILIVDDEPINIYAISILLERLKVNSDTSNNGLDGFNKYKRYHYPIILMDIEMPVMNGIEATQKILQYCNQMKISPPYIIAQTAYTDMGTQQICKNAGMDYFLSKPINSHDLKSILLNLLQ